MVSSSHIIALLNNAISTAKSSSMIDISRQGSTKAKASKLFQEAYYLFKNISSTINDRNILSKSTVISELHVFVAEAAYLTGNFRECKNILGHCLKGNIKKDKHYCLLKILYALLMCRKSTQKKKYGIEYLNISKYVMVETIHVLEIATTVHQNSTVAMWKILHPFIRPTRIRKFKNDFCKLSSRLTKLRRKDELQYIYFLAVSGYSCQDGNDRKEAIIYIDQAIATTSQLLFGLTAMKMILQKELSLICSISEDLRTHKRGFNNKRTDLELSLKACIGRKREYEELICSLYKFRIHLNPAEHEQLLGLQFVSESILMKYAITIQAIMSSPIQDGQAMLTQFSNEVLSVNRDSCKSELIVDLCRCAFYTKLNDVASRLLSLANQNKAVNRVNIKQDLSIVLEILLVTMKDTNYSYMSKKLTSRQYDGFMLMKRIQVIKNIEGLMLSCVKDSVRQDILHELCITLWNALYPLIMIETRYLIHKSLQLLSVALEKIASPFLLLRAKVHFELCKCELAADFMSNSFSQSLKALDLDYGALGNFFPLKSVVKEMNYNRPLDHIIQYINDHLVQSLQIKNENYESIENQVLSLLLQLEGQKSRKDKRDIILTSSKLLGELNPYNDVQKELTFNEVSKILVTSSKSVDIILRSYDQYKQILLWNDILHMAMSLNFLSLIQLSSNHILRFKFDNENNVLNHVNVFQMDCCISLAESLLEQLVQSTNHISLVEAEGVDNTFINNLIIDVIRKGLQQALDSNSSYGYERLLGFFFNINISTFKQVQCPISDYLLHFILFIFKTIDQVKNIGDKTRVLLAEAMIQIHISQSDSKSALDVGLKCSNNGKPFTRKHIVKCITSVYLQNQNHVATKAGNVKASVLQLEFEIPILKAYSLLTALHQIYSNEGRMECTSQIISILSLSLDRPNLMRNLENLNSNECDEIVEMYAECWVLVAYEAYKNNEFIDAEVYSNNCLSLTSVSEKKSNRLSKWLCVNECICGYSTLQIYKRDGISDETLTSLRLSCAKHFLNAIAYAQKANVGFIIIDMSTLIWNASFSLLASNDNIVINCTISIFKKVIDVLCNVRNRSKNENLLLRKLYMSITLCLMKSHKWSDVIRLTSEALVVLPTTFLDSFRVSKIIALGNLTTLSKMQIPFDSIDRDLSLQTKILNILAKSSSQKSEQMSFHCNSISLLKNQIPKIHFMIDLCNFMSEKEILNEYSCEILQRCVDFTRCGIKIVKYSLFQIETISKIYAMLTALEKDERKKVSYSLCSVYLLKYYISSLIDELKYCYKITRHTKLSSHEQNDIHLIDYKVKYPKNIFIPSDPLELMQWNPTELFYQLFDVRSFEQNHMLSAFPLLSVYTLRVSDFLVKSHHSQLSLYCLGWLRLRLLLNLEYDYKDSLWTILYFKGNDIMLKYFNGCAASPLLVNATVADYILNIMKLGKISSTSRQIDKKIHAQEAPRVFIDSLEKSELLLLLLNLSQTLLDFRFLITAKYIGNIVYRSSSLREEHLVVLKSALLLIKIDFKRGDHKDVISTFLGLNETITKFGDTSFIIEMNIIIIKSYMRENENNEAKKYFDRIITLFDESIKSFHNTSYNEPIFVHLDDFFIENLYPNFTLLVDIFQFLCVSNSHWETLRSLNFQYPLMQRLFYRLYYDMFSKSGRSRTLYIMISQILQSIIIRHENNFKKKSATTLLCGRQLELSRKLHYDKSPYVVESLALNGLLI